jgi:predicted transcriptional regulator
MSEPDIEEDLRRLREFERTGEGVPLEEVKNWVRSWGMPNELPPPRPRKI